MLFLVTMFVQMASAAGPGLAALEAGRLAEARTLLEAAVQEHPREALLWAALARTYFGLKLPGNAAEAANRAEQGIEKSPEAQHALALYYAQSGNRKRAAELECLYASSAQADSAAAARAAMLSAEVGHLEQAEAFGRKALDAGQRLDLIVPMLARVYETSGRMNDAAEMRGRLAKASPDDEAAQAAYGIALLRAARFGEAAAHLERSRKKFERSSQIELALGTAYYGQRRFTEAAARFIRVIELDPAVHQPYIFLARMIGQVPERAGEFLERAKAWHASGTRHAFAPWVYAKALASTGAPDAQVGPLLEEAIGADGSQWEFHFDMGQLLERARDYAGAARAYEKSLECGPQRPESHYRLARVYDRLGRAGEAKRHREAHAALIQKEQPEVIEP